MFAIQGYQWAYILWWFQVVITSAVLNSSYAPNFNPLLVHMTIFCARGVGNLIFKAFSRVGI